ncbi:MAG: DNA internalization-related competence protein ComEC/Rec2 [Pseudomonadota bacterium]|nr:DNA internalization-related competence protein ComEC/Rec2 [Pseudomonadota bacterium]
MSDGARTPPFSPLTAATLLAGIVAASGLSALPPLWFALVLLVLAGIVWAWRRDRWRALGALLFGFALLCAQGSLRLSAQLPAAMESAELELRGRVLSLPEHDERRTRFQFRVDDDASMPAALRGRVLRVAWYAPRGRAASEPELRRQIKAGEGWRFDLRLRAPRGLRNPGGFDGERQMLLEGVAATAVVRSPESAERISAARGLQAWRERMAERVVAGALADSARFVVALALGDTRGLTERDWQDLRATGLTHLIAISGFHVGMVGLAAGGLMFLICRLLPVLTLGWPRRIWMLAASTLGAFLYLLATGASLPTVRTVLMIAFVAGAMLLRRQTSIAQSVALALIAMLLIDPFSVLQPGFWLSFAGVVWLAWCLQSVRVGHVRQFLLAQGVASLALLPLTVLFFGQASLAGPVANLLAVPWWSLVVVPLSILGVLAEMLLPGAGKPLWFVAGRAFEPSWWLFERMASSKLALLWLPETSSLAVLLAMLAIFVWLLPRGTPGKALAALLVLPLLWPATQRPQAGEFELIQLDVGQGTAIVLRTASETILYDAGPAIPDGYDAGLRVVVPALHALGIRKLDAVIVSHADSDHAGGLAAVRRAFPVTRVLAPPDAPIAMSEACVAGDTWQIDGVRLRFLHPSAHFPYFGNQSSCVLRIEGAHGSALLTGDIDELIEARLLRIEPDAVRADIVTVAHHGSQTSSSSQFIEASDARLALISAGYGNRFRHPSDEVLERWQAPNRRVLTSFDTGALYVRSQPGGLKIISERQRRPRFWDAVEQSGRQDGAGMGLAPLSYRPLRDPP